ncbi:glycosyltransferase family 2 protein [Bifidobacterium sp. ESL0763]|uniref:glycosyltransferase family 2 protein n=1 Tax=Bifidobacterium sp. ESL0763 TaxID=2983227 RepID=UPI0023FA3F99|nr:glycosyltransferase family 2 protein [Bifidobacterium sp. ESL0763]MDF7663983.1 glycosyltransferase family 2 protein [Bifidobacterium sp. ESL0763]
MSSNTSVDVQRIVAVAMGQRSPQEGQSVNRSVAAVIAVEGDSRFLPETLCAVLAQRVLPGVIVIADCTGATTQPLATDFNVEGGQGTGRLSEVTLPDPPQRVEVRLARATGARSFYGAVREAMRYAKLPASVKALWLLHDDSRPADGHCLERLVEAWRNTPTVSLLGAKQLDWSGERLHDVGSYAGRHRLESLVVRDEPDQEQYDARNDVFAVSLAGALLPLQTLHDIGEPDPWFTSYGESADFSRRICLKGGRVVVVSKARIAHRQARLEGVRTRAGEPLDEDGPAVDSTMARLDAGQRYYFTDMRPALWPLLWIAGLFRALWLACRQLFAKNPYRSWCELCMPWKALAQMPRMLGARHRAASGRRISASQLALLEADRGQIREYKRRARVFASQRDTVLLSPLAQAHLRRRRIRRFTGAALMALVAFAVVAWMDWGVLRQALTGASPYSVSLLPSAAGFRQLFSAATTPWAFGVGAGVAAPPAPWLLVWLLASLLTLGHPAVALSLMLFLAAPAAALSFWALAGIFTRSDSVRLVSGLLWVALGLALGLFGAADMPMLTLMVFLPAAFAFVFRAVGMYHTEEPVKPHSSVQAAACASLCFAAAVCAEPQLVLPLALVFVFFILTVRSHRTMLLLIPIPSLFALAPTLVDVVRHAGDGAWRQVFADVSVPAASAPAPASSNLLQVLAGAFGLKPAVNVYDLSAYTPEIIGVLAVLLAVVVIALAALFVPLILRASRMMWGVVVAGLALALADVRIAVAPGIDHTFAASALPGVTLAMLALLCCVCMVAGNAAKHYRPLRTSASDAEKADDVSNGVKARRVAVRAGRVLLVVVLLAATCLWSAYGALRRPNTVASSQAGLPMVAVDYLSSNPSHRVLALKAESENKVDFTVMRSRRGDLADASPAWRAREVSGVTDAAQSALADASASLIANEDTHAVETITKLGFGGIYVVAGDTPSDKAASHRLTGNINASDGAQSLVSAASGTYYRLGVAGQNGHGVASAGWRQAATSGWRYVWMWGFALVLVIYVLVALPKGRRYGKEQA